MNASTHPKPNAHARTHIHTHTHRYLKSNKTEEVR